MTVALLLLFIPRIVQGSLSARAVYFHLTVNSSVYSISCFIFVQSTAAPSVPRIGDTISAQDHA